MVPGLKNPKEKQFVEVCQASSGYGESNKWEESSMVIEAEIPEIGHQVWAMSQLFSTRGA